MFAVLFVQQSGHSFIVCNLKVLVIKHGIAALTSNPYGLEMG